MSSKKEITLKLLEFLPTEERLTYEQALVDWWMIFTKQDGLRLTERGYEMLRKQSITSYGFAVPKIFRMGDLLVLSRKLDCPYYIEPGKTPVLHLFGSTQATMYAMYGDLSRFLRYLERT
jgi:hypothetical protein